MSSQARTQRSHRMHASWLTAITGFDMSIPRPPPSGRPSSRSIPYRRASTRSSLSAVVVSFGSSSVGGWSAISSCVSVPRRCSTSGVTVFTSMPSSHGRTHAAAYTRAPTSTTHMRQTPTGSYRSSWQRTGISMPMSFAACQIVVPSGTVTSRPSIVRLTVRISVGAGVEIATVASCSPRLDRLRLGRGTHPMGSRDQYPEPQIIDLPRRWYTTYIESASLVVPRDHGVEPLARERRRAAGRHLERLRQEALGQPVVGARPALAHVERALGEHDPARGRLELRAVDVPAADRAEEARPLGVRVLEHPAEELAEDQRVHHRGPVLGLDRRGD